MVAKNFLGFMFGVLLCSCITSEAHKYKYYVIDYENQILSGPTLKESVELKTCKQDHEGYKCTAMFMDEFFKMQVDYENMVNRVKELEKNCGL
jgi:hypothetical protein